MQQRLKKLHFREAKLQRQSLPAFENDFYFKNRRTQSEVQLSVNQTPFRRGFAELFIEQHFGPKKNQTLSKNTRANRFGTSVNLGGLSTTSEFGPVFRPNSTHFRVSIVAFLDQVPPF